MSADSEGAAGEQESPSWWVYILRCSDDTLYTGVAVDRDRRIRQHNGELVGGARYTRSRRPVELIWSEECVAHTHTHTHTHKMSCHGCFLFTCTHE